MGYDLIGMNKKPKRKDTDINLDLTGYFHSVEKILFVVPR